MGKFRDDTPELVHRNQADDAFLTRLWEPPRSAFATALYDRLAHQVTLAEPGHAASAWNRLLRRAPAQGFPIRYRLIAAAAAVLLLSTIFAWPAVADVVRQRLVVREVTTPAPFTVSRPEGPVVFAPTPKARRWAPLEQLAQSIGGTLLVPAYLPPGCAERERFTLGQRVPMAYLTYACVTIGQEWDPRNSPQPTAGAEPGATNVTVGGRTGLYWRGTWIDAESSARLPLPGGTPAPTAGPTPDVGRGRRAPAVVWREDIGQTLILEREGVLVTLRAGGTAALPKEELFRIAESLQPFR